MSDFKPAGWPNLIPRLFVGDPTAAVAFLRDVVDARGEWRQGAPAEMRIGDSMLLLSGELERGAMTTFLYLYVPDVQATFERALAAGAQAVEQPWETPWGDLRGMLIDPWGNTWQIATCLSHG